MDLSKQRKGGISGDRASGGRATTTAPSVAASGSVGTRRGPLRG